jgi:hypothetical protein
MNMLTKIAWVVFGVSLNALTVYGMTDYLIDKSMTGFNTSQTVLSNQVSSMQNSIGVLQGSMDAFKSVVDQKTADSKADLAQTIAKLDQTIQSLSVEFTKNLQENSAQLASLNATMASFDKRLNDTVARQERVEAILLKQHILFNPPGMNFEGKYALEWKAAGVDSGVLANFNDAKAIGEWLELSGFKK